MSVMICEICEKLFDSDYEEIFEVEEQYCCFSCYEEYEVDHND